MEDEIIQAGINIITPVFESAIVLAGNYAKMSGRDTLTATDLEYALKFCARNVVGKHMGTLFPDIQDDSDPDSDPDSDSDSDSEEPPFTRYSGDDETLNRVNECYDTWDDWVPLNPTEEMLKKSIDSRQWT